MKMPVEIQRTEDMEADKVAFLSIKDGGHRSTVPVKMCYPSYIFLSVQNAMYQPEDPSDCVFHS